MSINSFKLWLKLSEDGGAGGGGAGGGGASGGSASGGSASGGDASGGDAGGGGQNPPMGSGTGKDNIAKVPTRWGCCGIWPYWRKKRRKKKKSG